MRMSIMFLSHKILTVFLSTSRKSDIENERLPPELFDADSEEGKAILSSSQPTTPSENVVQPPPVSPNGVKEGIEKAIAATATPPSRISTSGSSSPALPGSPIAPSPGGFKRGHSRQASLGTTMTSPSTRRRSLESTMSLIQGVLEGKSRIEEDEVVDSLANKLAGSSVGGSGHPTDANGVARPTRPVGR